MKLDELLKKITPLPLHVGSIRTAIYDAHCIYTAATHCDAEVIAQDEQKSNAVYLTHAANVLPELVEALKIAQGHLTGGMDGDWKNCDPRDVIRNALARATEVKDL